MGDLGFFFGGGDMSECQSKERESEVSRGHISKELSVKERERRAESLKQGIFFFEVVKVNDEKQKG